MSGSVIPWPKGSALPAADFGGDESIPPLPEPGPEEEDRKGGGGGSGAGAGGQGADGGRFGPVIPLGTDMRASSIVYVLLAASGDRVVMTAKQLQTVAELSGLFGGGERKEWMAERWPQMRPKRDSAGRVVRDDDGRVEMLPTGDFSARDLGDELITACTRLGQANLLDHRKDGIWPGPDGGLVIHVGNAVWTAPDALERPLGWKHDNAIHLAANKRPRPAAKAATALEARRLVDAFRLWNFVPGIAPAAPVYLAGMVACGVYAAALDWCPHLWLRGPAGAGKSTLLRLVTSASGADAPAEDVSEAYVRNLHNGRSHLIVLDEKEPNSKGVNEVLALMRAASSNGRFGRLMDGQVTTYHLHVPFMLAAISTPDFEAADLSRITVLALRRGGTAKEAEIAERVGWAKEMHPAFLSRLVVGWPRFQANLAVYRAALLAAEATSRSADQFAALLAGHRTLIDDTPIDPTAAREEIDALGVEMVTPSMAEETDAGRLALAHLLASPVRVGIDGKGMMTVAALLEDLRDLAAELARLKQAGSSDPAYGEIDSRAKRRAREAGMLKIRWSHGQGVYLGNTSPQINRCFDNTTWANRVWRQALRDLPGAGDGGSIHFRGGGQDRAVFIPEAALRLPGSREDDPTVPVQPAVPGG